MTHLDDEQAADALAGHDPAFEAHIAACGDCAAKVDALRETLHAVTGVDVPEPSPLFWTGFAARVNEAIDIPPPRRAWWQSPGLAWVGLAAAAVLVVSVMLVPRDRSGSAPGVAATEPAAAASTAPTDDSPPAGDGLAAQPWPENDEAWEVVRSIAGDLDYDDAREAGIAPRPGAIELAAVELAEEERAELVRLIQDELKRTGA